MTQPILIFRPQRGDTPETIRERAAQPAGDSRLDAELEKIAEQIDMTVGERAQIVGNGTLRVTIPPHRITTVLPELAKIAIDNRLGILHDRQDFLVLSGFESPRFHFTTLTLAVPAGSASLVEHWVAYVERRASRGADEALIVHDSEDSNGTTFIQTRMADDGAGWVAEISSPLERHTEHLASTAEVTARIHDWMTTGK